ncbi:MAG: 5-dehydro-4-deoxy-D-glucuronate isomerase [Prolixibacteraceae bacterium]|nr:5-dehydro-4-deoxy-D-glucuronate isomerase [Prolixibacteraceae bacterium]
MTLKTDNRFAVHPHDFKKYDTLRIRNEFLVSEVMINDQITLTYSQYDRYIVGGAVPATKELNLDVFDSLKADYFLERREMGIINVGGSGKVKTSDTIYELGYKDALYLGKGTKDVVFISDDYTNPAHFYINSAPAHKEYPSKIVTLADANVIKAGSSATSNERQINQLLINKVVQTCQLQMGMTELKEGSVWNTMPVHTHDRRMEAYFYFNVPKGQAVCHFMGQPDETRHIWMKNEQAVLSPAWSIHSAAGTANYTFIWGMAGENLDYGDMDVYQPDELK